MEPGKIANPPDVVAATILVDVLRVEWFARDFFAKSYRFHHGTVAVSTSAHVVDLTTTGLLEEFVKGANEIAAMDVVPNLFSLISENGVRIPSDGAFHEVGEKSMQLGS